MFLDGVIGNAGCCFVVAVDGDGCRWLFVTEFLEDQTKDFAFLAVEEESRKFCFCCGGDNEL